MNKKSEIRMIDVFEVGCFCHLVGAHFFIYQCSHSKYFIFLSTISAAVFENGFNLSNIARIIIRQLHFLLVLPTFLSRFIQFSCDFVPGGVWRPARCDWAWLPFCTSDSPVCLTTIMTALDWLGKTPSELSAQQACFKINRSHQQ